MNNYSIISFSTDYLNSLKIFTKTLGSSVNTFRYFESRKLEDALKNHTKTLLLVDKKNIIGYGHLDKDPNDLKIWLGICIKEAFCGQGLGKHLIQCLLKDQDEDIYLSVDSSNIAGQKLYLKFGFEILKSNSNIIYMKKSHA